METNKILEFKENTELLLTMAEENAQKGRHAKAVSLLRRAMKNDTKDMAASYALSQELCVIGQYKLAADILFEMLTKEPDDPEVNLSLGEIFYALNNWNLAAFYFKRYSSFADDDLISESVADTISLEIPKRFSLIHPMTKEHAAELRQKGAMYMREGRVDDAANIFKEIEDSFPDDSTVKSDIAFTYLLKNDVENGKLYAKRACELNEKNISALCNLAMAYNLDGEKDLCDTICEKLNASETNEPVEIFKIASTFCEIKKDDMAFAWLHKFILTDPSQTIDIYYLYAFSAFNSGNFEDCQKTLNYILLLDPENNVAKYYQKELLRYLKASENSHTRWDYYPQIPLSVWRKRIELLNDLQDFYGVWQNDDLLERISWAFNTIDDSTLHNKLVEKLALTDKKYCVPYFKKLLLNQNLSLNVKGKIFFCLLVQGVRGRFFMVRDGYFSYVDVPKNIPHIVEESVFLCISKLSTLFLLDSNYPSKIIKIAKNIQTRILDNGLSSDIDVRNLSAVIARNCNFAWLDDKKIMDFFGVEYKQMTELNDYIFNGD